MDGRVRDRVADWSERPVEGFDGLRDLVDEEFSGVVEAATGTARFAMLNGRVLGVHGGRIEEFEDADAVARSAPEPGVALLVAMFAADAEPEDRYYTEDTPVLKAHETLSAGGFVGYLELSENVLSGDYYVAYYGGRSMPVAFVGNSDRLITGEEALERADDEVGVYHVSAVDVETVELPGTTTEPAPAAGTPSGTADDPASAGANADRASAVDPSPASDGDAGESRTAPDAGAGTETETTDGTATPGADGAADEGAGGRGDLDRTYGSSTGLDTRSGGRSFELDGPDDDADENEDGDGPAGRETTTAEAEAGADADSAAGDAGTGRSNGRPDTTDRATGGDGDGGEGSAPAKTTPDEPATERRREERPPAPQSDRDEPATAGSGSGTDATGRVTGDASPETERSDGAVAVSDDLPELVEDHERRIERLRERATNLEAADERATEERRDVRAELEEVAADLSDLRRTVVRLDRTVERLAEDDTDGSANAETAGESPDASEPATGERDLTAETALAETTLLLRYGSRGDPTLETAHDDAGVDSAAVDGNLRVDVHAPFDAETTTVDGRPYRAFVEDRIEYRFFEWLARDLLFEVRETGATDALRDLYDALPSMDRAELRSTVAVGGEDDETTENVEFDVVARDAHERPLVVARFDTARDTATEEIVVGLRDGANVVGEATDLAAAFSVTESYFSGGARDAAEEATADSILSRTTKESYVKLSRKRGYHLCLVAVGSDGEFHLRVPEL